MPPGSGTTCPNNAFEFTETLGSNISVNRGVDQLLCDS